MGVPRAWTIAGFLLAACLALGLLAGCTTTTNGVGSLRSPGSSGAASSPSTPPSTVNPGGPNVPVPNTTGGRPPSCPSSSCQLRLSASLAGSDGIAIWADDAARSAIVVLTRGGAPVSWQTLVGETPAQLSCLANGDRSNCILVDLIGAHGSVAHLVRESNGQLVLGVSVQAATPTMQARDLNQDGWIDVSGLQNDQTPNYAAGQVYWQTWLSDGAQLRSTGCGPRSHSSGAAPSAPLTGSCR